MESSGDNVDKFIGFGYDIMPKNMLNNMFIMYKSTHYVLAVGDGWVPNNRVDYEFIIVKVKCDRESGQKS